MDFEEYASKFRRASLTDRTSSIKVDFRWPSEDY